MKKYTLFLIITLSLQVEAQSLLHETINTKIENIENQVIEWRRHFHQYPELSNREFKTGEKIAEILNEIGLEVVTGVAKTGVLGILDTGRPGPTIGLRADIDGLPVTERAPLEFASKETTEFLGKDVGIMHACGHDTHIAMLLGAANILAKIKNQLSGRIIFIFQPAEEGAPPGEEGGAKLLVEEGLLTTYNIESVFGQHISSGTDVGTINYRPRGIMAAADRFVINVKGKQTHGSRPWSGIDPITVSAQIIMGLQTIVSRQTELTKEAAVISVGKITAGVRSNIIPESAEMIGTIRTLNVDMQDKLHEDFRRTVTLIAESAGAIAEVEIVKNVPVTYNDPKITAKMLPSLFNAIGEDNVRVVPASTGAEDFSYYANEVPSFFWFVGGKSLDTPKDKAFPHHTPDFFIDESGLKTGVKAMCYIALDYLLNSDQK